MGNAVTSELSKRLCSRQWMDFLHAFAGELAEGLTTSALRGVMARAGEKFAVSNPLSTADTVAEMQTAMNQIWDSLDWGWIAISEADSHLVLTHHWSPLFLAFGEENTSWSIGFLQGVYGWWLRQQGAQDSLSVKVATTPDALGTSVVFHFGK